MLRLVGSGPVELVIISHSTCYFLPFLFHFPLSTFCRHTWGKLKGTCETLNSTIIDTKKSKHEYKLGHDLGSEKTMVRKVTDHSALYFFSLVTTTALSTRFNYFHLTLTLATKTRTEREAQTLS